MHGPGYSGELDFTSTYKLPGGPKFSDDFHVFTVEWEPNVVRFYTDEYLYATFVPAQLPAGKKWVFDHPFYIILNLAVRGDWPRNTGFHDRIPATDVGGLRQSVQASSPNGAAALALSDCVRTPRPKISAIT